MHLRVSSVRLPPLSNIVRIHHYSPLLDRDRLVEPIKQIWPIGYNVKHLKAIEMQKNYLRNLHLWHSLYLHFQPSTMKALFVSLEKIHLSQSGALVQLLISQLPQITIYGISRTAETLACRRLEYLQSLPEDVRFVYFSRVYSSGNIQYIRRLLPT